MSSAENLHEIIRGLMEENRWLRQRVEALEAELDRIRAGARDRQARHRHGNVTPPSRDGHVTSHVTVTLHPIESDPSCISLEDGDHVPLNQEQGSNAHSGASRDRHVTFDRERAEADAAKHGLAGAAFEAELEHFEDYWASAGWKRKSGPVKDRNATWREWLRSPYRSANGNGHSRSRGQDAIDEWARLRGEAIEGELV